MHKLSKIIVVFVALLWVLPTQAHHAFSATFTTDEITVQGTVKRVNFTNPHVMIYFDVTDENGEITEWVSEGSAATSLRGRGWSRDSLKSGDLISISGNTSRNGSPMVSMRDINLVNPQTGELLGDPGTAVAVTEVAVSTSIPMALADGRPNLSGAWVQNPIVAGAPARRAGMAGGTPMGGMGAMGDGGPPAPRKSPNTIDLPGGFRFDEPAQLSAAGEALQANFDAKNDPQVQCEPPGLVRQAGTTPHPFSIQQYDDRIELAYEEYGGERTVYFNDRDLVGGDHSRFGQSIARRNSNNRDNALDWSLGNAFWSHLK